MTEHVATDNQVYDAGMAVSDPLTGLTAGTPVLTLDGELPVEFLEPGDKVITRSGMAKIKSVDVVEVITYPMRIKAMTQFVGRPDCDLLVGPDTQVLLRGWRARAMKGQDQVLIPIVSLNDCEYIYPDEEQFTRLYQIVFDAPQVIYAAGLEVGVSENVDVPVDA